MGPMRKGCVITARGGWEVHIWLLIWWSYAFSWQFFLCPPKMQHEEIRIVKFKLDIKKNILTNWITKCKSDHVIFLLKKVVSHCSRSKATLKKKACNLLVSWFVTDQSSSDFFFKEDDIQQWFGNFNLENEIMNNAKTILSYQKCCLVSKSYLTLCDPVDCSLPVRQQYWSGLPFPSPVDLPNPGTELESHVSPALTGRLFTPEPRGKPHIKNRWR